MELMNVSDIVFTELKENENLYDELEIHQHSVVPARYVRRTGYEDNPDVCALPITFQNQDVYDASYTKLMEYDPEAIADMTLETRKDSLLMLEKYSHPLNHIFDISAMIHNALISSYTCRESRISERSSDGGLIENNLGGEVYLLKKGRAGRPASFLVYGGTGCGKTEAVNTVCSMYPEAIRHHVHGREYIQIPILRNIAMVGNLRELVTAIGSRIDEILDTGTLHADKVRGKSVGAACAILKQWIKRYHIGLLIIDEVQFMNFGVGNSSFENIVSISEETGCAFGLIGNPEVWEKLQKYPRILSRVMQNKLEVNMRSTIDKKFFEGALEEMWYYQWTNVRTELTEEIREEILRDCGYNIAILKALLFRVQYNAVSHPPKNGITEKYIHNIYQKEFADLKSLICNPSVENDMKFMEKMASAFSRMKGKKKEEDMMERIELQQQEGSFSKEEEQKTNKVFTILRYNDGYSIYEIDRVIKKAKRNDCKFMERDIKEMLDVLREELRCIRDCPDTKVKVPKNKTVDAKVEQAVRAVMQSEVMRGGGAV